MVHNNNEVLAYWNQENIESMYDKFLINQEIDLIKKFIPVGAKILDAGCGEGEGTLAYASIKGSSVHAADFSDMRINKAKERLGKINNVRINKIDFLGSYELDYNYDVIISQRFLINLMEWDLQKKVIRDLSGRLKVNGLLLLLEGSNNGVERLNNFRALFNLPPIPVKWHNLFFEDTKLEKYLTDLGLGLTAKEGLSEYFLLTRGLRPYFEKELNWDSKFNSISASDELKLLLSLGDKYSRLKLWVAKRL